MEQPGHQQINSRVNCCQTFYDHVRRRKSRPHNTHSVSKINIPLLSRHHAHPVFADFLESYGKICARLTDPVALERMGRLFWFTVEFGLIRQNGEIKVYGSGLISSHGECTRVLAGGCEVKDFNLDAVLNQEFQTSEMQPVLYAVESFDQIYEATKQAESQLA